MSIRKTKMDCEREDFAHKVNESLVGTGINVTAGGRSGPYAVTISRVNRREMLAIVELLSRFRSPLPRSDS